jgi:hypothetical protein
LPLVVVRKRPTLTSFHPTPPGLFEPTTGVHQFGGGSPGAKIIASRLTQNDTKGFKLKPREIRPW